MYLELLFRLIDFSDVSFILTCVNHKTEGKGGYYLHFPTVFSTELQILRQWMVNSYRSLPVQASSHEFNGKWVSMEWGNRVFANQLGYPYKFYCLITSH